MVWTIQTRSPDRPDATSGQARYRTTHYGRLPSEDVARKVIARIVANFPGTFGPNTVVSVVPVVEDMYPQPLHPSHTEGLI